MSNGSTTNRGAKTIHDCVFCGQPPFLRQLFGWGGWNVTCDTEECLAVYSNGETSEAAIEHWNKWCRKAALKLLVESKWPRNK